MKYVFIKISECTTNGCGQKNTQLGDRAKRYLDSGDMYKNNINDAYKSLMNVMNKGVCNCRYEVKEVEE